MRTRVRELSDGERARLASTLNITASTLKSEVVGYGIRDQPAFSNQPVVTRIPYAGDEVELSVCGLKSFMIDARTRFTRADGTTKTVDCAAVAKLSIADSPVHVHGRTNEVYVILEGNGSMVLGKKVVDVSMGSVVFIPAGVEHGLAASAKENPVSALLVFSPPLARKEEPEFRDEKIVYERTTARAAELRKQS